MSGSAYKIIKNHALHHLTLLLNTDLDKLSKSLNNTRKNRIESKGVESVRSKVANIDPNSKIKPNELENSIEKCILKCFKLNNYNKINIFDYSEIKNEEIEKSRISLESWAWIFGQTPEFVQRLETDKIKLEIKYRFSKLIDLELLDNLHDPELNITIQKLTKALRDTKYGSSNIIELKEVNETQAYNNIINQIYKETKY